jgi:hypothetical protein
MYCASPVLTGCLARLRSSRFQLALLRTPSSFSAQIMSHLMGSSARYQMMLLRAAAAAEAAAVSLTATQ